jgi:uncharacterized RDD family membrane protein YckC
MAYCANCGREIDAQAEVCPTCGHPNQLMLEHVATLPPYAGFWIRVLGSIIDGIVLSIIGFVLFGFIIARARLDIPPTRGSGVRTVFVPRLNEGRVVGFLYQWLFLGLADGRTPGAMATGVRVARPDGSRIGLGTAAVRQAMAIVSAIPLGLGYLWMLWDAEKRTWHDMVANTRVFRMR